MTTARLELTRHQVLAFRRRVGALDRRLPWGSRSLRQAGWAGLQDSMPRAALLSIHARLGATPPDALADPSLTQVWGPRYSAFVVPEVDAAVFTLGRMPDRGPLAERALATAQRLDAFLDGRRMTYVEAGRALGVNPNSLRYATLTGRVRIEWDGARRPTIWMVPPPGIDAAAARLELARRYLHVFGPATASGFASWAGVTPAVGSASFDALRAELVPVRTPLGDQWALAADEAGLVALPESPAPARLLPSGDAYSLLQGVERSLLVPDVTRRDLLWTSRVWPGALVVEGEVAGTWRRSKATVTIEPWRRPSKAERSAVESEAMSFPLADTPEISVVWVD